MKFISIHKLLESTNIRTIDKCFLSTNCYALKRSGLCLIVEMCKNSNQTHYDPFYLKYLKQLLVLSAHAKLSTLWFSDDYVFIMKELFRYLLPLKIFFCKTAFQPYTCFIFKTLASSFCLIKLFCKTGNLCKELCTVTC